MQNYNKWNPANMPFGQVIVGPPGSGKSTLCHGMKMFLEAIGRKVRVINLDAANDLLSYEAYFDVCKMLNYNKIMHSFALGPNATMVKCMQELVDSADLFISLLTNDQFNKKTDFDDYYYIFDIPGQVELITNYNYLKQLLDILEERLQFQFCIVNVIDCNICTDPFKYLSGLVITLKSMLYFEYPTVNVLSKIDLFNWSESQFPFEFYASVQDPKKIAQLMSTDTFGLKHRRLTEALFEMIEDFGLIQFIPLAVEDKEMMLFLVRDIDKANGFAFSTLSFNDSILQIHMKESDYHEHLGNIEHRFNPQHNY